MINQWIRYITKNWKRVIIIILAIIIGLSIIQYLNEEAKKQNEAMLNQAKVDESAIYKTESVLGQGTITTEQAVQNNGVIENFISYCNEGKTKEAYDLLSEECKQEVFPTIDDFITLYYQVIFTNPKTYTLENWISGENTTYKVRFVNDALAMGGKKAEQTFEDYITIVYKNEVPYLNINKFVQKNEINRETELNGIKIIVQTENVYINNRTYDVTFQNTNKSNMILYSITRNNNWYLQDEAGKTYLANMAEITNDNFILETNTSIQLTINFMKIYEKTDTVRWMKFDNIQVVNERETRFSMEVAI